MTEVRWEFLGLDDLQRIMKERRRAEDQIKQRQAYIKMVEERQKTKERKEQERRERIAAKFAKKKISEFREKHNKATNCALKISNRKFKLKEGRCFHFLICCHLDNIESNVLMQRFLSPVNRNSRNLLMTKSLLPSQLLKSLDLRPKTKEYKGQKCKVRSDFSISN